MNGTYTSTVAFPTRIFGTESLGLAAEEDISPSALLRDNRIKNAFWVFFSSTGSHNSWLKSWEDLPIAGTPVLGDTPRNTKVGWSVVQEDANEDTKRDLPEYRAFPDRVALLARKFALKDKFSDEDNARLAIVTERVRKLLPAIRVEEYEILAGVLATIKTVAEDDLALRKRLGIAK
jgi:hypothetical protein